MYLGYLAVHHAFAVLMGILVLVGTTYCALIAIRADRKQTLRYLLPQHSFFLLTDVGFVGIQPPLLYELVRQLCSEGVIVWKPRYEPPTSRPQTDLISVPTMVPTSDDIAGVQRASLGHEPPSARDVEHYKFRIAHHHALAS